MNFNNTTTNVSVDIMIEKSHLQWAEHCQPLNFPQQQSFPEDSTAIIKMAKELWSL